MKFHTLVMLIVLATAQAHAEQTPTSMPQAVAQVRTVEARQQVIAQKVSAYGAVGFSANELTVMSFSFPAQIARLDVSAGQMVKKGTVLFEAIPDPSVQANLAQAQSAVNLAQGELQRVEEMSAQQLATQSQVAAAKKALTDAHAGLAALLAQGISMHAKHVTAPFDGVVVGITANQGDRMSPNMPVMQLGHTGHGGPVHVMVGVEPTEIGQIRNGAGVSLKPVDVRLTQGRALSGVVSAIKGSINAQTRLMDVTVSLDPRSQIGLPSGTLMHASIEANKSSHWVVPRSAVLTDEKGDYLFQAVKGQAQRIAVTRQVEEGNLYGVDGALTATAPVISSGNYVLADGMQIREVK